MNELKREFDHQLSGIAWSLWNELGVAGVDHFHTNCLIQVEELVILTSIVSEYDPRLRDEALDWCSRYHELISVSRLRTLLKEVTPDILSAFAHFVSALNSISSAKWPNAAEKPHFKVKISEKSLLPPLELPPLLMLRLRSLFGPGVRADVLTHFLTRNKMHFTAADLVEIGYSKRSLLTALDHLAASGIVFVTNVRNKKSYELKKPKELQVVIGKLPKIAPPWNKILRAIIAIRSVIPEIQNSSEISKSIIFRNCLNRIESLLPTIISPILKKNSNFKDDWNRIIEVFKSFAQGNFFMQFAVHNEFDKIIIDLLQELYQVNDCIDGIGIIRNKIEREPNRHGKIYKECYQLFLSFIHDLKACLEQFFLFPFYKIMDESLSDISYQFSKEKLPKFSEKLKDIKSIDKITNSQSAIIQYQLFMPDFEILKQFIYSFRKRLEDLYFDKTDIHLLSRPDTFNKRHLVLSLFSK
ncbi:MAG: hypothetical protein KDK59_01240 [Simkania sp.]|nr:hypothetical protein [Simkania sp.]MCP5491063.1 hypothetical protein [Chlamydiales bacterium]